MRYKLYFDFKNKVIPTDYRRGILSYLKSTIQTTDEGLYNALFHDNDPVVKPYSFSVYLPIEKFEKKSIVLRNNGMIMTISTGDPVVGLKLYNAFLAVRKKEYPFFKNNTLMLTRAELVKEPYSLGSMGLFKTLSPVAIRCHNKSTNQDDYLLPDCEAFNEEVRRIIQAQCERIDPTLLPFVEDTHITFKAWKKQVVHHYSRYVDAAHGVFELEAHPSLLSFLYMYGIGSHRSAGFGLFEEWRG